MTNWLVPLCVVLAYGAVLFSLANRSDRPRLARVIDRHSGVIAGLGLAAYCTSWTLFGAVGTATASGWHYLPIYLGPIILFLFGRRFLDRLIQLGKAQHSTSIADFLSARYGKSGAVAALVTLIALVGALPYMALQLKSVGQTLAKLSPDIGEVLRAEEIMLGIAIAMAGFAVLFGTQRADLTQHNRGLVVTIALEAAVKGAAIVAVAVFALLALADLPAQTVSAIAQESFSSTQFDLRFLVMLLISMFAVLCLPRQFHMMVVESREQHLAPAARWLFPAYLVLISAAIIPVMLAGKALLPPDAPADMRMIDLPLAFDAHWLALGAFIGGLSASTGMIVVESIALSRMITNDIIVPLVYRGQIRGTEGGRLAGRSVIAIRRASVFGLLLLAYVFTRSISSAATLAGLGEIAFAAIAQFSPGLLLGMVWRGGNRIGMIAGLVGGFALWLILLAAPLFIPGFVPPMIGTDPLVSGTLISVAANASLYVLFSLVSAPDLSDRVQAVAFVDQSDPGSASPAILTNARVADLRQLLVRFAGDDRAAQALNRARVATGRNYRDADPADRAIVDETEAVISAVIGSSSARALVESTLEGDPVSLEKVVVMFGETSQRLQFGAELLQIAIENIDQGIAVVDSAQRLVAWNSRYVEMFDLPPELVRVGRPIADLIRFNLRSLGFAESSIDDEVAKRLAHLRAGRRHSTERRLSDGRVLRVLGNAAPDGGYVTTYTDITADRLAEQALEAKVAERTQQLVEANHALEAATQSKTRFLAAASHDLIQPLNAARLFASALQEELPQSAAQERGLLRQIDRSIETGDRLLRALLDISRLDGGRMVPQCAPFPLDQAFADIANEFDVQARAKGLRLRLHSGGLWVLSDRGLFMSVLQNLVTNALRYSDSGSVLVGARRRGTIVDVFVADQGRGIGLEDQERIFEEFTRLGDHDDGGLGLGLAIVRRITAILETEVRLSSSAGRGSCFSIRLPIAQHAGATAEPEEDVLRHPGEPRSEAARILCIDNDRPSLAATEALLRRWGHDVHAVTHPALITWELPPDLILLDYRLDDGLTGDAAAQMLSARWGKLPAVVLLTAENTAETQVAAERMNAVRLIKPISPAALRALVSSQI